MVYAHLPGVVEDVLDKKEIQVSGMMKGSKLGSYWRWPAQKDLSLFKIQDIVFRDITIEKTAGTSRREEEFYVHELSGEWTFYL